MGIFFNRFVVYSCFFLFSISVVNAQEVKTWRNVTEISCDGIIRCLTQQEMQSLVGKTLKYRHMRFKEFGFVYITIKTDGKVEAKNDKGPAIGTWTMKDNVISFKTDRFNDFVLFLFQIDSQLFIWPTPEFGNATAYFAAVIP